MNELYHHGIKGQKWGVRRYQNYDGTRIKQSGSKRKVLSRDEFRKMVKDACDRGEKVMDAAPYLGYTPKRVIHNQIKKKKNKLFEFSFTTPMKDASRLAYQRNNDALFEIFQLHNEMMNQYIHQQTIMNATMF